MIKFLQLAIVLNYMKLSLLCPPLQKYTFGGFIIV